jgi:hypothetical protein
VPSESTQQRRVALVRMKLGALVRDHAGEAPAVLGPFGGGAALVRDGEAWVLADDRPARALGPALAWARQQGATGLNVLVDDPDAAGILARRASYFTEPPGVFVVDGRTLRPAVPAPLTPPPPPPLPEAAMALVPLLDAAGAVPVIEHGVLTGEVAGLEVCRVVTDPDTGAARLEVGVGAHDREAFQLLHGDVPPVDALAGVVAAVAEHRRRGAPPHPLNRLGAERRLRSQLLDDPSRVGALALAAAPPPVPRPNLKDAVPCVATGVDEDVRPLVVVCSVGIDLDVVPFAADARAATFRPDARLVIAVAPRDDHPVTRALSARLRQPAEVVTVAF